MAKEQKGNGVSEYQKGVWRQELSREAAYRRSQGLVNSSGHSIDRQEELPEDHLQYRDPDRPPKKRLGHPDKPHGRHFKVFRRKRRR